MKRIILILLAVWVSNGWLMANHWSPNSIPYESNMTLTGVVRINSIEQQTAAIEVGAFCGEECRGSALLQFFAPTQRYVVQMIAYGNNGDTLTFRLYDHNQNEELDLITYDAVVFSNDGYGSLSNPYTFNFYSEPPGPHIVTVTASPEVSGVVSGGGSYEHGATATLTATANEDYVFVDWTRNGEHVSDEACFSFTVIEPGDFVANFALSINPHWTPCATPYDANMTLTGVIQINGQEQQTPMLEVGAFCGEECRGSGTTTFFAPMQRYVVQLVVYGNQGDPLTFRLFDHEQHEEMELHCANAVTFTSNGYGSLANPYVLNFTEAHIESHAVTAEVNPTVGGTVSGAGVYLHGTSCTLTATANENYTFVNWTENDVLVSVSSLYEFEVTSDVSLVANFVPLEDNHWVPNSTLYENNMTLTGIVQINYIEQHTTAIEVGAFCGEECRGTGRLSFFPPMQRYVIQSVVYGNIADQLTFKLFDHLQGAELDLVSPEAVSFTTDGYGSLTNPYVLDFLEVYGISVASNPTEGGTTTGAGDYIHGTTATLTATANTGYHFVNWTQGSTVVSTESIYSFEVTEAADLVANFEINSYAITATANPEAGGTITGAGTYDHFSTCTLTATPNTGYHFVNWTQGGTVVSSETVYSFEVTGAADLVANFELDSYAITATANPEAGGTITGAGTYNHFSTCTLTATPNTGYHFVNWTQGSTVVSTESIYSFEVTEAADLVANFEINSYAITATANPEAGGTITGAGTYDHFSTCTLTATANEHYAFVNWTKDGEVVSTEPTYTFTVTEAASYVANFELSTITQTANYVQGWNWWSSYVEADDVLTQLETSLGSNGSVIKSQNNGSVSYLFGGWYGSINGGIQNENTYMVNANTATEVSVTGNPAQPADHPITLTPGWTWIGYPNSEALPTGTALSGHTPQQGDALKNQNATATYMFGSWYGSLSTLTPGTGLMYNSNRSSNVTFTYSTGSKEAAMVVAEAPTHWHSDAHAYPYNMNVLAVVELDGEELHEGHYEVAAFANGECRGSACMMYVEPIDRYMVLLTISGDEATNLTFGLYDAATGMEETQDFASLQYETDAIIGKAEAPHVLRFRSTTGVDEWANSVNVFPNPVERGGQFSLGMTGIETGMVQIDIINALGMVVEMRHGTSLQTTLAAPTVSGVYTLRISVKGKGICYRKLVVD